MHVMHPDGRDKVYPIQHGKFQFASNLQGLQQPAVEYIPQHRLMMKCGR